jgi:hypothetical protein
LFVFGFDNSLFLPFWLLQSLAREFGPQGIHVAHVVIDGVLDLPAGRQMFNGDSSRLMSPEAIADQYWNLYTQHPSTWTQEMDLRPSVEKF